jgi:signal transduction histidine kinase
MNIHRVGLRTRQHASPHFGHTMSVTNSGSPIPAIAPKQIFQPFTRGVLGDSKQGLGLGLYIAHQIALAHGGTLRVCPRRLGALHVP